MPTSAQSAFSASASVCAAGSDGDREPARDNVFPSNVNDHRRASARSGRLDRDSGSVDRDELALDNGLGLTAAIPNVHELSIEPLVFTMRTQRSLRTW